MENTVVTDSYVEAEFDINDAIAPADRKPLLKARWLLLAGGILLLIERIINNFYFRDVFNKLQSAYYWSDSETSDVMSIIQIVVNIFPIALMIAGFFVMSKTKNWQIKIGSIVAIIAMIIMSVLCQKLSWAALVITTENSSMPWSELRAIYFIARTVFEYLLIMCSLGIFLNVRGMDKKPISRLALSYVVLLSFGTMVQVSTLRFFSPGNFFLIAYIFITFLQIIFWWKLCSNSYPLEDTEKKPLGAVIFNRLTVGFLAMIPLMILVFYVLATTILPEINNGYYY